ncbi:MAG: hypothetical protein LJU34_01380 [Oscillospiraceae bacterium]|nr:hypothetical protein [Oscillospiraceae bacterium]
MKKFSKLLALLVALCMILSVSAFASGEASGEASAEAEETVAITIPETAITVDVSQLTASDYAYLTNYSNRDDSGNIYIGTDITEADQAVVLDETVTGAGYTAVYVHGEDASATITGVEVAIDDTDGLLASDFSGQGTAVVAYDGAFVTIEGLTYYSEGFERTLGVVSQNANIVIKDSDITVMGADPLTEAWEGYHSSADQNAMISPPWPLGITGGGRVVNMIGENPTLTIIDSTLVAGETWGILSTDAGSNMIINVVDTELTSLSESEGGSDSGWRIFGYDEDAYGSAYGAYYIGTPTQYYYGATFNGVTYAAIITGANEGHYASSNGTIDLYDANGNLIETVEGEGNVTTINGVFGFMQHNSLVGLYIEDGTVINAEEAAILYKASDGAYYFDEAELNVTSGILIQMMDNDDDSRIGGSPMSAETGFDENYSDSKISSTGEGFPGLGFDYTSGTGGNTVTATFTNGDYVGDILNGTGYYGQSGDNLTVTIGEGATLTADIALTSTIKGVAYSEEAIEGIEYYGDDIAYLLVDAEGNVTDDAAEAAYIQITDYTINEYFLQGHVQNIVYYNGASTAAVVVEADGVWTVTEESLITSLSIAEGATVYGELTENADGTLTLTPSEEAIPAGEYGGTLEAVGGGTNVGGGVTDDGTLDVGAAADAMAEQQGATDAASGEASGEASAETADAGEVTWADYQAYLIEAAGGNAPDLDEFTEQVMALESWDDIDESTSPWDQMFTTVGISTWDDFVAAGGAGAASIVEGAMG